jgi:DNA-binding NarL/FixJ family response regulator
MTIRILLIDDDTKHSASLKAYIENHDKEELSSIKNITEKAEFEVFIASDTTIAWEEFLLHLPQICVVKVFAPLPWSFTTLKDETGITFINKVKEEFPDTKCVAYVSCEPDKKLYYLLKELGANDAISWPARPQSMAGKLYETVWTYRFNTTGGTK